MDYKIILIIFLLCTKNKTLDVNPEFYRISMIATFINNGVFLIIGAYNEKFA